jgi:hypothetical protein
MQRPDYTSCVLNRRIWKKLDRRSTESLATAGELATSSFKLKRS